MSNKKRFRLRIIVPTFTEFNIYTRQATKTTALGPICAATSAKEVGGWDVEVIDENNLKGKGGRFCPQDKSGLPDHKKLQELRPADVVGFYCSLTSTMPRVFELAKKYKSWGVKTIAGGKHVESLTEEALNNNIDIVSFGDGEITIKNILRAIQGGQRLSNIYGVAFLKNGQMVRNVDLNSNQQLILPEADLETLPFPDFSLLLYARIKIYPVCWWRGCGHNCEFCAVKGQVRCSPAEKLFNNIVHLAEQSKARKFFIVDDHFGGNLHQEEHLQEVLKFCRLMAEYQKEAELKLCSSVQIRLNAAKYPKLLQAMRRAGVELVCIGYESPIDEELRAMRKGYLSKDMAKWTEIFRDFGFFVHGMFMFGYPRKKTEEKIPSIPIEEKTKIFKEFIRQAKIDTAQVLLTVPLPGTELWRRIEGRIFSRKEIGWEYYDGQFPLFIPDDNISPEELQQAIRKTMGGFYHIRHFWSCVKSIIFFPIFHFFASFTIITLKVKYITATFRWWNKKFFRNARLRFGGYLVIRGWIKNFEKSDFLKKLSRAKIKTTEKTG